MKIIKPILLCICLIAVLVSGYMLAGYTQETEKQKDHFTQIAVIAEGKPQENTTGIKHIPKTEPTKIEAHKNISALQAVNSDCVAWIEINGTNINYPIMQTVKDPEFYLRNDFDKNGSRHGVPFLDYRCNLIDSDNLIIYGHHMSDGSMFSELHKYMKPDFCGENQIITLYTVNGKEEYEIFAVLPENGVVTEGKQSIFNLINCIDQVEFDSYIEHIKETSLYDMGNYPKYSDKLLTLTTCEYSQENGRLAVVARKL